MEKFQVFANNLADQARTIALKYFRQPLDIERKSDSTPVSIADKEIEEVIRAAIIDKFPSHGLFGEEFGSHNTDSEWCWVIDPIDGTKSFITGHPTYGCLIALLNQGKPVLGIIEMPALAERWLAINGHKTLFNGQPVSTRDTCKFSEAIVCTTGLDFFNESELPVFEHLSTQGPFRMFGGDCYNYGLLASGFVDVVIESDLKPYDYMALAPVIESAGGVVSDWQGNPLTLQSSGQVLASANRPLHQQCLEQIREVSS